MAVLNLLIASLTALFASFLSLPPTIMYGLAPWYDTLSTPPPPTPPASPKAFFTPEFWEAIPTANLAGSEAPPPPPTQTLCPPNEQDDEVPVEEPPQEESTAEDPLQKLWELLKQALQRLTIEVNDHLRRHPYLPPSLSSDDDENDLPPVINCQPPVVEGPRRDSKGRQQRRRIRELEKKVKDLTAQLAAATSVPATTGLQPVFGTGSASPLASIQGFDFTYRPSPAQKPTFLPPPQKSFTFSGLPPPPTPPQQQPFTFSCSSPSPPPPPQQSLTFSYPPPPPKQPFTFSCASPAPPPPPPPPPQQLFTFGNPSPQPPPPPPQLVTTFGNPPPRSTRSNGPLPPPRSKSPPPPPPSKPPPPRSTTLPDYRHQVRADGFSLHDFLMDYPTDLNGKKA